MTDDQLNSTMSSQIHNLSNLWGFPCGNVWKQWDCEYWVSKWGEGEQKLEDGKDKGKNGKRGKNKDLFLGPLAAPDDIGLNQAIQFTKFMYTL